MTDPDNRSDGVTPKTTRRGRGRPRAGQEPDLDRLLQGALDAFAEQGYDGTSVRGLSRSLGVSHALLTARFGSKEGLWFAAMEHALAQSAQTWRDIDVSPALDDLEALRQALVQQVIISAAHPQVTRIMSREGGIDSPRIRFVVERFINPLRPGVEHLLARLIAAGRIRPVPYATLHYLGVVGGGAIFANPVEAAMLGAPSPPSAADVRAHAHAVADICIAGITIAPSDTKAATMKSPEGVSDDDRES
ncbi:TetR/AcrR family transcriptional regulator [Promicromonospora sp. Populi]|uniref:TetR/AcrR family transcriptional regulator n=1 Tax=Promicromonospora sp. Populi TaxID=3239420 RepID=UPI0034E261EB